MSNVNLSIRRRGKEYARERFIPIGSSVLAVLLARLLYPFIWEMLKRYTRVSTERNAVYLSFYVVCI